MAACVIATSAQASLTISGTAYNSSAGAANLAIFNAATSTKEATFTSSALNFNSTLNANGYTLGGFINTVPGTSTGITYMNGYTGASDLNNTVFEFTGTAYFQNGVTYTSSSDDGEILKVGGVTEVNKPGPQVNTPSTFVFAGTTGSYSFDFLYGETAGAPADFITPLTSATPEPGYFGLMGIGISAAFYLRRRKANG